MSDKIEIQGKTVEAAVSEALLRMGARRDEVEIKVLEEPKSGFMGFLGGRAAKVMVRKKRSRGRGGSGRDFRVDDDNYQAHNLSGGRGRGSRRRPSGDSGGSGGSGGSRDRKNEGQEAGREEKSRNRRGSRGRGGRGRNQEAAGRKPAQDQQRDQQKDQQKDQQQDRREQPVKAENRDQSGGRSSGGRDFFLMDDVASLRYEFVKGEDEPTAEWESLTKASLPKIVRVELSLINKESDIETFVTTIPIYLAKTF